MANLVPDYNHWHICPKCKHQTPLFVKEWVGLTDDEIKEVFYAAEDGYLFLSKAIEAKLKEKNT